MKINMAAEFHLFMVTAVNMAWHKFFSLSLYSLFIHPFLPPSLYLFNIAIAWYHCFIHASVIDLPHILLLHASLVKKTKKKV